jgi:hypothetical protein
LAALGTLALPALVPAAPPEDRPAAPAESSKGVMPFALSALLPTDPALPAKISAARDYVRRQSWAEAVQILQGLLDLPQDVFLAVKHTGADGKEVVRWVSARAEADRLVAGLPRPGLAYYEAASGAR